MRFQGMWMVLFFFEYTCRALCLVNGLGLGLAGCKG